LVSVGGKSDTQTRDELTELLEVKGRITKCQDMGNEIERFEESIVLVEEFIRKDELS